MKLTLAIFLFLIASTVSAQSTVKLFDAVPITYSDQTVPWAYEYSVSFKTAEVYLNCPASGAAEGRLTGPNGGNLVIDNFMTINGANVCPFNCFSGVFASPFEMLGQPVGTAYLGIAPVDISSRLNGSGVYKFDLMDYGGAMGSNEVYLESNCDLEGATRVCHRNNGRNGGSRTLTIGESAVAAHLAHGDTAGPCSDGN